MTDLELIFSILGEASTKEITINRDAQGFAENKQAAVEGGIEEIRRQPGAAKRLLEELERQEKIRREGTGRATVYLKN